MGFLGGLNNLKLPEGGDGKKKEKEGEKHEEFIEDFKHLTPEQIEAVKKQTKQLRQENEKKKQEAERASKDAEKAIQDNVRLALPAAGTEPNIDSIKNQLALSSNHFAALTVEGKKRLTTELNKMLDQFKLSFEFKNGQPIVVEVEPLRDPRPLSPDVAPETPFAKAEKAVDAAITAVVGADGSNHKTAIEKQKTILEPVLAALTPEESQKLLEKFNKGIEGKTKITLAKDTDPKKLKVVDAPAGASPAAPGASPERQESNFIKLLREIFKWIKEFMEDWKRMTVKDRQEFLGYQKRQTEALEARNKLDADIKGLNEKIRAQEELIKKLQSEGTSAKDALEKAQKELETMKTEKQKLDAQLKKQDAALAAMKEAATESERKMQKLTDEVNRIKSENNDLKGLQFSIEPQPNGKMKIRITWKNTEKLREIQDALTGKLESKLTVKDGGATEPSVLEIDIADPKELETVRKSLETVKAERDQYMREATEVTKEATAALKKAAEYMEKNASLKKKESEDWQQIQGLKNKVQNLDGQLQASKNELVELRGKSQKDDATIKEKEAKVTSLAKQLQTASNNLREAVKNLTDEKAAHETTKKQAAEALTAATGAIKKAVDLFKSEREAKDALGKEHEKLKAEVQTLTATINDTRGKLEKAQADLTALEKSSAADKEKLAAEKKAEVEHLTGLLTKETGKLNVELEKVKTLSEELETARKKNAELTKSVEELKKTLKLGADFNITQGWRGGHLCLIFSGKADAIQQVVAYFKKDGINYDIPVGNTEFGLPLVTYCRQYCR